MYLSVVVSLCRSICSYLRFKTSIFYIFFFSSYSFNTFCYLAGFELVAEQYGFSVKVTIQLNYILRCLICTLVLNHCVSEMKIY